MKRAATLLLLCGGSLFGFAGPSHWVATWAASPARQLADEEQMRALHLEFSNQTLREIVHTSIGGGVVRVRLSNVFGKQNAEIGAAHLALRGNGAEIVKEADRELTFSGRPAVSIPPNAIIFSDPVNLKVPANADLAVSLYLAKSFGAGIHYGATQTSYIGPGNQVAAEAIADPQTVGWWSFLAGVDVNAPERAGAIVAFGDSITDGAASTPDTNRRWPNDLANRLLARKGRELAVVDAGIGGNRILHDAQSNLQFGVNALARFDQDALDEPGVKYVIVLEGINDLGHAGSSAPLSETVSVDDLIAGLRQLIERCHDRGVKIFGATLTPFEGTVFNGYFSAEKEIKRKALNEWIRTGNGFDGVIDFDKAIRDPAHPDRVLPAYDSGDHLHPGDAGYKAMADSIDLGMFK